MNLKRLLVIGGMTLGIVAFAAAAQMTAGCGGGGGSNPTGDDLIDNGGGDSGGGGTTGGGSGGGDNGGGGGDDGGGGLPSTVRVVTVAGAGAKDGTSWANAYEGDDLQTAINEEGVEQVWVAAGTYSPTLEVGGTGDRYKSFQLKNGVAVYGGFAGTEAALADRDPATNVTILSGNPSDADHRSYHVVSNTAALALDATAALDGFTITGGNADGDGADGVGGGMVNDSSSPTIANCTFTDNAAKDEGGGVYNNNSNPAITNATFTENTSEDRGGGMSNNSSHPTITTCAFTENESGGDDGGGGMYNNSSSPVVTDCTFTRNRATGDGMGGGMSNDGGSPSISNSIFTENTANRGGGGMVNKGSSPALTNCLFAGNTNGAFGGGSGGGINDFGGSDTTITNSTFTENTVVVAGDGGAIVTKNSTLTIVNSILWGNAAARFGDAIYIDGSAVSLSHSCYEVDGVAGGVPVETEPLHVEPELTAEYALEGSSPAIDEGENASIADFALDLAGNARIVNAIVDMGAYEYQ